LKKRETFYEQQWIKQIERALAQYENIHPSYVVNLRKLIGTKHGFLLLNWKSWSQRYAVSVDFILTTLLDYYGKRRQQRQGKVSLGIATTSLTGTRAREIVEHEVAAQFPGGENFTSRSADLKNRILTRRLQKFPPEQNLATGLLQYRKTIFEQQERNATLPTRFLRPWRGNPFNGTDTIR